MLPWLSAPRIVEPAKPDDFETLEEIHAASFRSYWSADEQAAMAAAPGVAIFVARRGSATASRRPIGFITVRHAAGEGEILTMAVLPRQRKGGIGRMLLDAALKHLASERVEEVFLEVDPGNKAALALYKGSGFVAVGERPDYYAADDDSGVRRKALTMHRSLSPQLHPGPLGLPKGLPV